MYLKIVLFVLCVAYAEAKKCPVVRPAKNFYLAAFASGVWHDLARYPNSIETSKACMSVWYTYDGNIVTLSNPVPVEGPTFITATGKPQPDGSIYFKGSIGTSPKTFEVPMTIIKVKYDKYAIKYSCIENGDDIIEFAWVVSRSANLNAAEREELNKFIKSSKLIDSNRLFWINYSDRLCKGKQRI